MTHAASAIDNAILRLRADPLTAELLTG